MRRPGAAAPQSTTRLAAAAGALVLAGILAACAPTAFERAPAQPALQPSQETFEASGRLSARYGAGALAANFEWRHAGGRDELELASPLGQTVAFLSGDGTSVRLQAADGRVLTADSWTALTEQALGWPLPVDGLKYWLQGAARAGAPFSAEPGEDGRAMVLRQDGWTMVYQAYAQTPTSGWRPVRMTASYPEVELRLAIDRWQ